MKVEINVPDNLSQDRLRQEIQEFEQRLKIESELDSVNKNENLETNTKESKRKAVAKFLAWTKEHKFRLEGGIPSREERNAR